MNGRYRNNRRVPTPEEVAAHRAEMLNRMTEKAKIDSIRNEQRAEYEKMGFQVDTQKVLKSEFYIDVKAKEVKIDEDFYDRGDDYT